MCYVQTLIYLQVFYFPFFADTSAQQSTFAFSVATSAQRVPPLPGTTTSAPSTNHLDAVPALFTLHMSDTHTSLFVANGLVLSMEEKEVRVVSSETVHRRAPFSRQVLPAIRNDIDLEFEAGTLSAGMRSMQNGASFVALHPSSKHDFLLRLRAVGPRVGARVVGEGVGVSVVGMVATLASATLVGADVGLEVDGIGVTKEEFRV